MTTRKNQTPTLPILDAIDSLNAQVRKFHPEAPETTIVLGSSGKLKNGLKLGHFAPSTWAATDTKHEILISGEALGRGAEAVLATLLHENAHAIAHTHDIRDTSNNGRYHNKRFKVIGEALGLVLTNTPTIGWSGSTLAPETALRYQAGIDKLARVLTTYRVSTSTLDPDNTPKPKERNKTKTLVDCECESPVTVSKIWFESASMHCNACDTDFQAI